MSNGQETQPTSTRDTLMNLAIRGGGAAILGLALSSCASGEDWQPLSPDQACNIDNARQLPSKANINSYTDDRLGDVLACMYLNDMRIPSTGISGPEDVPRVAPLVQMRTEEYDSPTFTSSGSFDGWAAFGVGKIEGDSSASAETKRERRTIAKILDIDGNEQLVILNSENVKIAKCKQDEPCNPALEITVSDQPMWEKEPAIGYTMNTPDTSSIWYSIDSKGGASGRTRVVNTVSNGCNQENYYFICSGGPKTPGEVIGAVASSIVVRIPSGVEFTPETEAQPAE